SAASAKWRRAALRLFPPANHYVPIDSEPPGQRAERNSDLTVQRAELQIANFMATPTNIAPGEVSTLSWTTQNAKDSGDQRSRHSVSQRNYNGFAEADYQPTHSPQRRTMARR